MNVFLNPRILVIVLILIFLIVGLFLFITTRRVDDVLPSPAPTASTSVLPTIQPSVDITTLPIEEQIKLQNEADKSTANFEQDLRKKYPWYTQLPIGVKDTYFVYFDKTTEKLVGKIYASKTSDPNQQEQLKQQIITRLQGIGINTNTYVVNWQIVK